jgi:hypothetical protein
MKRPNTPMRRPEILRLGRIEIWREARRRRALDRVRNDDDRAKAMRAAALSTEVTTRLEGLAMGAVSRAV